MPVTTTTWSVSAATCLAVAWCRGRMAGVVESAGAALWRRPARAAQSNAIDLPSRRDASCLRSLVLPRFIGSTNGCPPLSPIKYQSRDSGLEFQFPTPRL